ncbi:MAG: hypothetical protein ACQEUT_02420 [Bacillota bacterium]
MKEKEMQKALVVKIPDYYCLLMSFRGVEIGGLDNGPHFELTDR